MLKNSSPCLTPKVISVSVASAGPAVGGDEDDVEHPERVHHAQDQRQEGGGQQQGQNNESKPLRRARAVDRRRLQNVERQRLQSGEQNQRHQRRPFPGVDGDQRRQRFVGIGEQAARAGSGRFRRGVAEHAIVGVQQRLEDQSDDQRRHGGRNEQQTERDAVEEVVPPQQQRDARPSANSIPTRRR